MWALSSFAKSRIGKVIFGLGENLILGKEDIQVSFVFKLSPLEYLNVLIAIKTRIHEFRTRRGGRIPF